MDARKSPETPIPGTLRERETAVQSPNFLRRALSSISSILPSRRAVETAAVAGVLITGGALAAAGIEKTNEPPTYTPNEIKLGTIVIGKDTPLKLEPVRGPLTETQIDQGKKDPTIIRSEATLEGHSLEGISVSVDNAYVVDLLNGEKWYLLKGVQVDGQTRDLFFPMNNDTTAPLDTSLVKAVPNANGEIIGQGLDGRTVLQPDQIEKITISAAPQK